MRKPTFKGYVVATNREGGAPSITAMVGESVFPMSGLRLSIIATAASLALCGLAYGTTRDPSMKMVLDSGNLIIRIPQSAAVTKHQLNFETDEYTVVRRPSGSQLLRIVVGGGAYDLRKYKNVCLNHKRAWRLTSPHGTEIVLGVPGVNAVYARYENVSSADAAIAREVMASIEFRDGRYCR